MKNLPYGERIKICTIPTLKEDMIETNKILVTGKISHVLHLRYVKV